MHGCFPVGRSTLEYVIKLWSVCITSATAYTCFVLVTGDEHDGSLLLLFLPNIQWKRPSDYDLVVGFCPCVALRGLQRKIFVPGLLAAPI